MEGADHAEEPEVGPASCRNLSWEQGEVQVGKYIFCSNFDSGNGHRWNLVDDEYIVWTRPDCEGAGLR